MALPIDALMVFLAFVAAYWLRAETEILQVVYLWPFPEYLKFIALMLPAWVVIFALAGLYTMRTGSRRWGEFTKIFLAVSAGIMFFVVWVFLSRTLFFSRLIVIYAWILAIVFVSFGRFLIGLLQRFLFRYGIGVRSVIIIGQSETAESLKNELDRRSDLGYRVINGLVKPNIKALRQFLVGRRQVDEILVADSDLVPESVMEFMALAEEYGVVFRVVPNLFEVRSTNIDVQTLAAVPVIEYRRTSLTGWAGIVKRVFDVAVASLALFLLSPLFVLISTLIKLDSAGPVYYHHRRLGLGKKPFYLYKFRSMKLEYCTGDEFERKTDTEVFIKELKDPRLAKKFLKDFKLKAEDDPRLTRVGKFLRRTSLDELPQLFNVILGQLSLVGPRPIIGEELERYGTYKHRLFVVKPGVTGLWQVSGRSDMPYKERVKLDMYYIENWSLWSDLIILVKTFFVMMLRKNAY